MSEIDRAREAALDKAAEICDDWDANKIEAVNAALDAYHDELIKIAEERYVNASNRDEAACLVGSAWFLRNLKGQDNEE